MESKEIKGKGKSSRKKTKTKIQTKKVSKI
jgi:hypothetical protein